MALANVGGSNEHPRKLRRDPLATGGHRPPEPVPQGDPDDPARLFRPLDFPIAQLVR
jgi:hypothetical protein